MVVINPDIENTTIFNQVEWKPLLTAHKKRSSVIFVSSDEKYLKKTKKRKGFNRDNEFYNLEFWNVLLENYHKFTGTDIYAPKPYISEGRDLIMQYAHGTDMDRLLTSASVAQKDLAQIIENLGKLCKIKENENLLHNDFDLRHILINGGVFIIDLENAQYGNGKVKEENEIFVKRIKEMYSGDIETALQKGYESVPKLNLVDHALEGVKSVYGGRAEFYLKSRYRQK